MDALCCKIESRFYEDDRKMLYPDVRAFLRYVDGRAAKAYLYKK